MQQIRRVLPHELKVVADMGAKLFVFNHLLNKFIVAMCFYSPHESTGAVRHLLRNKSAKGGPLGIFFDEVVLDIVNVHVGEGEELFHNACEKREKKGNSNNKEKTT